MSAVSLRVMSLPEYLAFDRTATGRHEFLRGKIYAMAGASANHVRINRNLTTQLTAILQGCDCEHFPTDLRVVCPSGLYTYPDMSIVCGEPEFADGIKDTLRNPTALIEILSPGTEKYDRGDKFDNYRSIDSLREYVLIAQDRCRIEVFRRESTLAVWEWTAYHNLSETVQLATGHISIPVAAIYHQVTFETASEPTVETLPS